MTALPNVAPKIAVLLSGHGFGHTVRTAAILERLAAARPLSLHVVTEAPQRLWPVGLRECTASWSAVPCDPGVVQSTDAAVDEAATRAAVNDWHQHRDRRLEAIEESLPRDVDFVIADVPPLGFELSTGREVPGIAIANFSWDWIYQEMGLPQAAVEASRSYARATLLVELTPAAPMPAFAHRREVGIVTRRSGRDVLALRRALGVEPHQKLALLALRPTTMALLVLPPPSPGLRFVAAAWPQGPRRADCLTVPDSLDFIDAVAGSDVVISKPGYGIIGDCVGTATPLLWSPRSGFPEDRLLEPWLEERPWAYRIEWTHFAEGRWASFLEAAWSGPCPEPEAPGRDGTAEAAGVLLDLVS